MPITPSSVEIYDTSAEYSLKRVSYGSSYSGWDSGSPLLDGTSYVFEDNYCSTIKQICEYNLIKCLYLNLDSSSITSLNTQYLGQLRVLVLYETYISSIFTDSLVNLLYLDIACTKIKVLSTTAFSVLEQLWMFNTPIESIKTTAFGCLRYFDIGFTEISSL